MIQAALVEGDAPLLISRPALKTLGAELNFADDSLKLFNDRISVPLSTNTAGQYVVNVVAFNDVNEQAGSHVAKGEAMPSKAMQEVQVHVVEPNRTAENSIPIVPNHKPEQSPSNPHDVTSSKSHNNHNNANDDCHNMHPSQKPAEVMSVSKKTGVTKKQLRSLRSQVKHAQRPLGTKYAVVEVFSPPRFTTQVEIMGFKGLAIDLKQG